MPRLLAYFSLAYTHSPQALNNKPAWSTSYENYVVKGQEFQIRCESLHCLSRAAHSWPIVNPDALHSQPCRTWLAAGADTQHTPAAPKSLIQFQPEALQNPTKLDFPSFEVLTLRLVLAQCRLDLPQHFTPRSVYSVLQNNPSISF